MIEEFLQLVEEECGGMRRHMYRDFLASGEQRHGQAFMNALHGSRYFYELHGTQFDPFYKSDVESIHMAIDWLTTKNENRSKTNV